MDAGAPSVPAREQRDDGRPGQPGQGERASGHDEATAQEGCPNRVPLDGYEHVSPVAQGRERAVEADYPGALVACHVDRDDVRWQPPVHAVQRCDLAGQIAEIGRECRQRTDVEGDVDGWALTV